MNENIFTRIRNHIFNNREVYIWPFFYLALLFVVIYLVRELTGRAPQADASDLLGYVFQIVPVLLALLITAQADGHLIFSLNREEWLRATIYERILDCAGPLIIFLATLTFEYYFIRH